MLTTILPFDIAALLPAIGLLLFCVFYMHRNRKVVKDVYPTLGQERWLAFEPEPLIDYSEVAHINKDILELHQPDESDPDCLNLAKVNFLNFLNKEEIKREAEKCIRSNGVGSCGPRGFYGTIDIHLNLESKLAEFLGVEETVLYSYGFSTIASAIGAYCKRTDIVFCDEKINFCAAQGILAAKSRVVYFKHNYMADLEEKLKEYQRLEVLKKKLYRKFLIVEGIYANTGTICPLPELMKLRKEYKLRIFIDESLSFGVLGKTGKGVTEHFDVDRSDVDMIMGSLEGSIGSIGGFCAGASVVIEHQRLSGLGYCFSASLPPYLSQISIYALDMFEKNPEMFQELQSVSVALDDKLKSLSKFVVVSDRLSPLKVLTVKDKENATKVIETVHSFCVERKLYLAYEEEHLKLNAYASMEKGDFDKIVTILNDASKFI